ncbi:hypothetical protein N7893_001958 [Vibrio vulnificus]|nr:hypothetical protein [Vibrio vulnificus]EJV9422293.1 hypothetical protein [Vibrio vulnificus]MCU8163450.1 hypothetical protein [Vibrio vulnificus]
MKLPWQLDDATVCYEINGCVADRKMGIAVRGSLPLRNLPKQTYDVSVKDVFMSGVIESIIAELNHLETKQEKYLYVTNRYQSIKVWINRSSKELNAASATPFASAVINNAGHLVMTGATAGFANTVVPVIEGALSGSIGSNNATLVGKAANAALQKGASQFSPLAKNKSAATSADATGMSLLKGLATDGIALGGNIKAAFSTNDADVSFVGVPIETPVFRDKTKRKNKVRALLQRAKQLISPDKLIIRVGSEFNRHHAGCVIDLGVRAISVHDLIDFLTIYVEKNQLINCFHDRATESALLGKVEVS